MENGNKGRSKGTNSAKAGFTGELKRGRLFGLLFDVLLGRCLGFGLLSQSAHIRHPTADGIKDPLSRVFLFVKLKRLSGFIKIAVLTVAPVIVPFLQSHNQVHQDGRSLLGSLDERLFQEFFSRGPLFVCVGRKKVSVI